MNQVVIGAVIPFIIALGIYMRRKCRASFVMLIIAPAAVFSSALWAIIPDIPRLLGMESLYLRLMHAEWTDIFWFHYTIDKTETISTWPGVIFVIIWSAIIMVANRELTLLEKE